jgi:hypothetical protein
MHNVLDEIIVSYKKRKHMEIILNKDYGGFGLSEKAKALIIKRKGMPFYPYAEISYDNDKNFRKVPEKEILDGTFESVSRLERIIWASKNFGELTTDDKLWSEPTLFGCRDDRLSHKVLRVDKDAIEVVKELGEKANGDFALLKVVSIPDGSYYYIDSYDGKETCIYSASPINTI